MTTLLPIPTTGFLTLSQSIDCPCGLGACVNISNAHAAHFSISLPPLTNSTDSIPPVHVYYSLYSLYATFFDQIYILAGFKSRDTKPEDTSRRARRADDRYHMNRPAQYSSGSSTIWRDYICYFAYMHIVAVAYTVFALMCAQNALLAFSLFATPKRADKINILFITTLHYTLAVPFAVVALTFAYLTWHCSPAIWTLPPWIFGFSCAALAHTLHYSLRALIDHFYSPFTSALCYLSRFGCLPSLSPWPSQTAS